MKKRLAQVTDEYRQLFEFFFVFRVIALPVTLICILVEPSRQAIGLMFWFGILLYTLAIYVKWREIYALLLKRPVYLGIDLLVSIASLTIYSAWSSPFYFYSIAPIIPAAFLFRLKGALYSSSLLTASEIASVFLHGATLQGSLSPEHFPLLLGQTAAYYTIGFMVIYPSNMLTEIVRQRSIIKEKTEKEAIYEERARLSRDLHDNLAQMLSAIKLKANVLAEELNGKEADIANQMGQLISLSLQDLRSAIFALRPENIEKDFSGMLSDYCRRFSSASGCKIDTCFSFDDMALSAEQKYEILRICQEAIANAVRHSGTAEVKLEAMREDSKLAILIEDSGMGFDPSKTQIGVGLFSMRERAEKLKGTLEIISVPSAGTKVTLTLPLKDLEVKG